MAKKNALGKGLGALIRQSETESSENKVITTDKIDIEKIEVNPYQPRTHFDTEALEELAASIKQLGIIQPITVRETDSGQYQIISGERRYRASLLAGLTEMPAYIRHAEDSNMLELALVENIQREDLDAMEIAISYQRLIDECELTQEEVSDRVGKKRPTIANYLRLLRLPAEIQLAIRQKKISMGHARALVNLKEEDLHSQMLQRIIDEDLSVRQVEQAVQQINNPEPVSEPEPIDETPENEKNIEEETNIEKLSEEIEKTEEEQSSDDEETVSDETQNPMYVPNIEEDKQLKEMFSRRFGAKVDFKRDTKGAGRLIIPFKTDAELQYIIELAEKLKVEN